RAAPPSDHHDLARVRDRRAAARAGGRRGCECAALDRHRHHRRHARRDDARDAVRAAAVLSLRQVEGRQGRTEGDTSSRTAGAAGGRLMKRSVIALVALLSGCMVGPDYTRPPVDAPKDFIYETKDAADTANTQWWKQFNDPVLDGLIAESLAKNYNVKVAAANVEQ